AKDFDGTNDGYPVGSLLQASDGKLYGIGRKYYIDDEGSAEFAGIIFSIDPATSAYTLLFDGTNGRYPVPMGSLVQASNGKLYGMTNQGGSGGNNDLFNGFGVIFSFDPVTSTYTIVFKFGGGNGRNSYGSLLPAIDGKLYGLTTFGGSNGNNDDEGFGIGYGVIFSFDPITSTYTKLKDFDGTDGRNPYGSLLQASNGKLYGMTNEGGSRGYGVIFSFDPATSTYTNVSNFDGTNGGNPYIGAALIEPGNTENVSCPSSIIVSADKGRCDAIVNNIDPVFQGGNTLLNYTLSGATVANGTGSVSGKRFNTGITTVTYSSANDASKNCSFTVTVNDDEPPFIENFTADPASLWPPNHKMKNVTITYDVTDNCGFTSPTLSVSSNEINANNADWVIVDNHHIQLRAEKEARGKERIYTITISATDLSGNKSIETIEVSVSKDRTKAKSDKATRSAIIEAENIQTLTIKATPNPSFNYFTISTKSNSDKPINVRVTDVFGRVIETRFKLAANGKLQLGSNYRQGIYLVEVMQGSQRQVVKVERQ
ncbi:MAG: choice-of-anchor tandem repeat GloVer-containing protein, partial [Ginsengibacter sp.]